jgi:glutamate 5-kinase
MQPAQHPTTTQTVTSTNAADDSVTPRTSPTSFTDLPPTPETLKKMIGHNRNSSDNVSIFKKSISMPEIPILRRTHSSGAPGSIRILTSMLNAPFLIKEIEVSSNSTGFQDVNLSSTSELGADRYYKSIASPLGHQKIEHAKEASSGIMFKVGSTTLVDGTGKIKTQWISSFAETVKKLMDTGKKITIVASGAVATGRFEIPGLAEKKKQDMTIPEKQLAAGVGQPKLMKAIQDGFAQQGIKISQELVSEGDMKLHSENRTNLINTYNAANQYNVVMVFNANDAVDISQLTSGDNDALAMRLAGILKKDTVVIFSDIMGYHTSIPVKNNISCKLIPIITSTTIDHYASGASGPESDAGTGGMAAKFAAIKDSFSKEITTIITLGNVEKPGATLFDKNDSTDATWFIPEELDLKFESLPRVA